MRSEWKRVPLGEVVELKRGYDLPTRERTDGPFPIVSSSGVSGSHITAKVDPPGVVTGRYGTIGEVYYVEKPFWPLNTALYVRDFKGNDPRFISYLLQTVNYQSYQDKGAVPGVNRNHLHLEEVVLPPLAHQKRIADILGTLDDKIDLNCKMDRTLEAMARAIFKSWFVDFDPVRAKQAGEKPVGVDADAAALFPDRLVDSELGEIPEGWEVKPIKDVMSVEWGCSPPGDTYNEDGEGLPFFQGSREFRERFPEVTRYCTDPKRIAEPGDTMMSIRAPVGTLNMADRKCIVGRGVTALRHESGSSSFTYHAMHNLTDRLGQYTADGTVFKSITKRSFVAILFLSPPEELIDCFEQLVGPMDAKILANSKESRTLAHLRDVLLPTLLRGIGY